MHTHATPTHLLGETDSFMDVTNPNSVELMGQLKPEAMCASVEKPKAVSGGCSLASGGGGLAFVFGTV